ncbi:DUF4369 domain-containing protein [Chitinophaga sedimenti]|uniref:DUF4369 domain-containing protein n=1 Tax=Chitinophaga sedimenti TaxID=2033606 RepID=UPI002003FEC1|nr:DUF4369 domain-containing protein [Chitinophaga sedimenti]MCK7555661.1 DUF4369 domain-containing protein [Chitinophaga sedimenti]
MTYKQFILPVLLAAATPLAAQQGPFTLDGKVEGKTDAWIYLNYAATEDAKPVIDSALIRDRKFSFSGEVNGITSAYLLMDKYAPMQDRKYLSAYLVPGKMRVAIKYDNFSDGVLTGSSAQDEINKRKRWKPRSSHG